MRIRRINEEAELVPGAITQRKSIVARILSSVTLAVALLWGLMATPFAYAHADVIQSTPEANSVQTTAPTEVVLRFSQSLDPAGSRFTVTGPDGTPVNQGESQVAATDSTAISVLLLPNLVDGVYSVQWTSLSLEDGDEVTGSLTFTVAASTNAYPAPAAPAVPDPAPAQPDMVVTQPDMTITQQQPATALPVTAADPGKVPSLAIAGCLLLVIAGVEFRRRSRDVAERAAYAHDLDR